jgi:DNA modification methylase
MENKKEYRPITELHNWEKNPRSISKSAFEQLKKHIIDHGQMQPLVITPDGEVLGGNMRLRAYRELNINNVWVEVVEPKDEAEKLRIALVLNDRAGYYDDDLLANLTAEMPDFNWADYSVDLKEPTNLGDLLDQFKEVVEDEVPEVSNEPAVSKLGEVYQLGRHRLMCGDSTKIEDVEKLMNGQKADMVFTDPPYGMRLDADFSSMPSSKEFIEEKGIMGGKKYRNVIGDGDDFTPDLIQCIFTIPAKERFIWGGDYFIELLPNYGKDGNFIVWDKKLDEKFDNTFSSTFELLWSEKKHKKDIIRERWVSAFGTEQEFDHKRHHPTQKPIKVSAWVINKYSDKEWLVVDIFGGSGSTLIACEQTNRICFMMEIDPKYVSVILDRWEKFTGLDAIRVEDGKKWKDIKNVI